MHDQMAAVCKSWVKALSEASLNPWQLKPTRFSLPTFGSGLACSSSLICLFRNSVPIRGFNYTVFDRMVKSLDSRLLLLLLCNLRRGVGTGGRFHGLYAEPVSRRRGWLSTAVGLWWAVSWCRCSCRTDSEPWRRRRGRAFARADREPIEEHVYSHLSFDTFVLWPKWKWLSSKNVTLCACIPAG